MTSSLFLRRGRLPLRFVVFLVVTSAVAIFLLAWESTRRSRADSMALLVEEGKVFTAGLAEASRSAMLASSFYDRLAEEHYYDLTSVLNDEPLDEMTDARLARFVRTHDLSGVYVYTPDTALLASFADRSAPREPPEWVQAEVAQLALQKEAPYVLLVDQPIEDDEVVHYFISLSNRLDRIVVLSTIARYHTEAARRTGIGVLAQAMARQPGVEYILYQTTDGIVFASRNMGQVLAIESDPYLQEALDSDTTLHRIHTFQDEEVLELALPFTTEDFPIGLFRIGLSLDRYYAVSRGFDLRMIVIGFVLFALLVAVILYLNSRRRGHELSRRFTEMKSLTDQIFRDMKTGVVVVDSDGIINLCNPAAEALLGRTSVVGRVWSDIVNDEQASFDDFLTGSEVAGETELRLSVRGKEQTILVARSKVRPLEGEDPVMVAVLYDMTRLRQYERQSARRERLSEMGNLAAGVAHEIRNPLNTISIAAQRLASEFTPSENADEYVGFTRSIRQETRRLNDIITRFLALAREDKKSRRPIRLDLLLRDTVDLFKPEADRLSIKIHFETEPDLVVQADPDRLKQILTNLFNNSKEALAGDSGQISVVAAAQHGRVGLLFADSGPGIPADLREKVITPYFTTKDGGTGLGLPTVHTIVSDLGGELEIGDSELGGAEIIILLPAAESPA
jgi:PAS domain S-box-containing protein